MAKTAIIGGGAAGFFCAIQLKTFCSDMEVTIFESKSRVLSKVEISGGGRCNCTNTFRNVTSLSQVYPRGFRLMNRLFKQFGPKEVYSWFENHGVDLVVQDDECVFPKSQDSHTIINCFLNEAYKLGIKIKLNSKIENPLSLFDEFDYVVLTTGGLSHNYEQKLSDFISVIPCVPSLFTFTIKDKALNLLMGLVVDDVKVTIPNTKLSSQGPLLITHWGVSGPSILKLSSYAARFLAENNYKSPLIINWSGITNTDSVYTELHDISTNNSQKQVSSYRPFGLQTRLWEYLLEKAEIKCKWGELGNKGINKLTNIICNDKYKIDGRAPFKDEFVTCGGVDLKNINMSTLESKQIPHLYFAGEILDIDGITGGFNFQAAWTTAYAVADAIQRTVKN